MQKNRASLAVAAAMAAGLSVQYTPRFGGMSYDNPYNNQGQTQQNNGKPGAKMARMAREGRIGKRGR